MRMYNIFLTVSFICIVFNVVDIQHMSIYISVIFFLRQDRMPLFGFKGSTLKRLIGSPGSMFESQGDLLISSSELLHGINRSSGKSALNWRTYTSYTWYSVLDVQYLRRHQWAHMWIYYALYDVHRILELLIALDTTLVTWESGWQYRGPLAWRCLISNLGDKQGHSACEMITLTMNTNASTAGFRDPKRLKSKLLQEESMLKRRLDKLGSDRSYMLKYFQEEKKKFERKLETMNSARHSAKSRLEESKAQLERRASARNRSRPAAESKPVKVHTGLVPAVLMSDRRDLLTSPRSDSEAEGSSPEPQASESDPDLTRLSELSRCAKPDSAIEPPKGFTRIRSKSIDAGQLSKLSSAKDMNSATSDLYHISKRFSNIPLDDIIEVSSDITSLPDEDADQETTSHLITRAWLRDLPIPKDGLKLPNIRDRSVSPTSPKGSPTFAKRVSFSGSESSNNPSERPGSRSATPRSTSRDRIKSGTSCGSPTRRYSRQTRIDLSVTAESPRSFREASTPRDISPPHPQSPVPTFSILSPNGELVLRSPNQGEMDFLKRALSGNKQLTTPLELKRRPSFGSDESASAPGTPTNKFNSSSPALRPSTLKTNFKDIPKSLLLPKSPTAPRTPKVSAPPEKSLSRFPTENNLSKSLTFGSQRVIRSHDDDVRALTPIRERSSTFSGCSNPDDDISLGDSGSN